MGMAQRERVVTNLDVSSKVVDTYSEEITATWHWNVANPGMWDRQYFHVKMRSWDSSGNLLSKKKKKPHHDVKREETLWQKRITFHNADKTDHYSIKVWCKNQGPPFTDSYYDTNYIGDATKGLESKVSGGGEKKVCCKETSTGNYDYKQSPCPSGWEKVSDANCENVPPDVCCMNKTIGTTDLKKKDTCKSLSNWKVVSDERCKDHGGKSLLEKLLYFIKHHKLLIGAGGGLFFFILIIFAIVI